MDAGGPGQSALHRRDAKRRGRSSVSVVLMCCVLVLGLCAAGSPRIGTGQVFLPLYTGTVAVGAGGALVGVLDDADLVPGTRVLAHTSATRSMVAEQRSWLAAGTVPHIPELGESSMVHDALLDLHVLSTPDGVPVAGWAGPWRYVWPRDSALAAVALARTGHIPDAERVITFLENVQPERGTFEARYRPDGTAVMDGRTSQTDGLGWALWAMRQLSEQLPAASRRAFVQRHRLLLDRSTRASLALVDNPRSLPPASPDYWETPQRELTLSTAALVCAGLDSAQVLYATLGQSRKAENVAAAATRTAAAISRTFGPDGYPRQLGGGARSVDLGVSFLLPPFVESVDDQVAQVWHHSAARMARPAGGLSPGGSWRDDGVSWSTATSSNAMTAAFLDGRQEAVERLRWLDEHRTGLGSIPEKILYDGRPASVAPLAWAAAAVIIAVGELQDQLPG
jgi:glucoamylase